MQQWNPVGLLAEKAVCGMTDRPDPRLLHRLRRFSFACTGFSAAVGLSSLVAWKLHIASLNTWGVKPVRMVANTAACFVLSSISLWLQREAGDRPSRRANKVVARVAAAMVVLTSALSLAEHVLARDLGIDQLLAVVTSSERIAGVRPGLMSPITATDFLVLALALLLLDWRTKGKGWPAQFLGLGVVIGATFGLLALVLEPGASSITMALPTAVTFLFLAGGLIGSRAAWAVGGLLTSPKRGARLLRRAVPAALLILGLFGWLISGALLTEVDNT
jgi:hypothetical protein